MKGLLAFAVPLVAAFTTSAPPLRRALHAPPLSATLEVNGEVSADVATPAFGTPIRLTATEKARTVTSLCTSGTLCTVSRAEGVEGAPFGSHVDYVLDDDGSPILLMNKMSLHTKNILEAQQAEGEGGGSALVTLFTQILSGKKDGQDSARCSVTGRIEVMDEEKEDMAAIKMRYSIEHSYADQVVESPFFSFYRLVPEKIYYVGGFGVSSTWVVPEEYRSASPDILARESAAIVAKLNAQHRDDLTLVARHLLGAAGLESVRVTAVDRLGIDLRVTERGDPGQSRGGGRRKPLVTDEFRIGFRIPVISVEDAKSEVLKVFQEAWEKSQGYIWDEDDDLPGSNVPILKVAEDGLG